MKPKLNHHSIRLESYKITIQSHEMPTQSPLSMLHPASATLTPKGVSVPETHQCPKTQVIDLEEAANEHGIGVRLSLFLLIRDFIGFHRISFLKTRKSPSRSLSFVVSWWFFPRSWMGIFSMDFVGFQGNFIGFPGFKMVLKPQEDDDWSGCDRTVLTIEWDPMKSRENQSFCGDAVGKPRE